MRIFRKHKKAVSPVLAVLLMIAVAVAASLVTYAWVMGYLGFTTAKVGKAIQIQSITNQTTGSTFIGNLTIYVQNVGDGTVKLMNGSSVYVNGIMQPAQIVSEELPPTKTAVCTVVNYLNNPGLPYTVKVKIVTEDGTFIETSKTFG